jgi:hypothetical protein
MNTLSFSQLFSHKFTDYCYGDLVKPPVGMDQAEQNRKMELPVTLTIREITIPRLQRDYAQGRAGHKIGQIRKDFLSDLHNAVSNNTSCQLNFIYGKFDNITPDSTGINSYQASFLPLDGQQRLTTLFLIHWYASRKEGHGAQETAFDNFSYHTRFTSEAFGDFLRSVKHLTPDPEEITWLKDTCPAWDQNTPFPCSDNDKTGKILSRWLENKYQFSSSWKQDPTVSGMLVMLDAIHAKFHDVPCLLEKLTQASSTITFNFLPITEISADADDIFIKMNSRGKLLTEFEYFKADFLRLLGEYHYDELEAVKQKFDHNWEPCFWHLSKSSEKFTDQFSHKLITSDLDLYLIRYVNFIIDTYGIKTGVLKKPTDTPDEYDKEKLLEILVCQPVDLSHEHTLNRAAVSFLITAFDCWYNLGINNIGTYFKERFVTERSEIGKMLFFSRTPVQLLSHCLLKYGSREFTLDQHIFLHAILVSLNAPFQMTTDEWIMRFRIIQNLFTHMDYGAQQIAYILNGTEQVILTGVINDYRNIFPTDKYFTEIQINEENFKYKLFKKEGPESPLLQNLWKMDEHPWLRGRLSVFNPQIATSDWNSDAVYEEWKDKFIHRAETFCTLISDWKPQNDSLLRHALLLSWNDLYCFKDSSKYCWGANPGKYFAWASSTPYFPRSSTSNRISEALLMLLDSILPTLQTKTPIEALREYIEQRKKEYIQTTTDQNDPIFNFYHYLVTYYDSMVEYSKNTHGIMKKTGTSDFNLTCYQTDSAKNDYWDPFLVTILAKAPDIKHLFTQPKYRGRDFVARPLTITATGISIYSRPQGFCVAVPKQLSSQVESIVGMIKEELQISADTFRFLFPIRNDERGDKEDRIQNGISLFQQLVNITPEVE